MQVSNINNNTIKIKSQGNSSPFKSGTQFKATVTQVNSDGTVILESDKGTFFTASNTSNYGLNVGDTVSLLVTEPSHDGSAATTAITQINGQPIDQNVSLSELHLIDLGIMPNAGNLRLYNILNKYQLPLTKEFILNLKDVLSRLPGITDEQAAFMATNDIEPTLENLNALTNIGALHEDLSALIKDSLQQVISDYGISKSNLESILNALNEIADHAQVPNPPAENEAAINPEHSHAAVQSETAAPEHTHTTAQGEAINPEHGTGIPSASTMAEAQTPADIQSINHENPQTVPSQVINGNNFISDKPQTLAAMKNYALASMNSANMQSEAVTNIMPKVVDSLINSVLDKIINNGQVTLKSISDLKLPEQLPKNLQQTISALPKEAQQEIMQIMPDILRSSKEFLSIKLIKLAEQNLNVPINRETSGTSIKNSVKNMPSNINAVLTDKVSNATGRTITSLKLSDNTMSFVQIPVTLNDFKTSAEIYIVKRDSSKKLSLENGVKIVFALNTENLGRVESIISANTRDLNLHIRVENSSVKDTIERDISYLKTLLSATNFNLSLLKVTMIDKKVSVLNAHTFFGYKQLDITV